MNSRTFAARHPASVPPAVVTAPAPAVVPVSAVNNTSRQRSARCPPRANVATTTRSAARTRLNDCDLLICVVECFMMHTIRRNEEKERTRAFNCYRVGKKTPEPSVFHALQAPSITPIEYLKRLARYSFCSRSVFVAAFLYLQKIAAMEQIDLSINSLSVHRLLLTAVLVATKVIDDVLYDNAHFAKVGGLDVKELNMLELDMLKVLNFRLFIKPEEFEAFEEQLLDCALNTTDPDYLMLSSRLRNLGYGVALVPKRPPPSSPASTMDICFSAE